MTNGETAGEKPRLLVLTSTYPRWPGDSEPGFVHELTKRLAADFQIVVLGPHAPGAALAGLIDGVRVIRYRYAPERWQTLVNDGGIVANLRRHPWKWMLVPGFLVSQAWNAWRMVRFWRPDVIHAHWLLPQGLVAAVLRVIDQRTPPFVVTSHGTDLFSLRAEAMQALKRFVVNRAAALTVMSAAMLEELGSAGIDRTKASIQPMGVDVITRFKPDPAVLRSTSEVLFVGRLLRQKGLHHLIEALPLIRRRFPSAHLSVAGFGPEQSALRAQVEQAGLSGCVMFLGATEQSALPALYSRAAVCVAPSTAGAQEGLGLVLVEAAGCGCPLVVGDVPGMRDVVRDTSIGIRVPPGDVEALADAVCTVLATTETEATTSARIRAVQCFDWQQRAEAYAALLRAQVRS